MTAKEIMTAKEMMEAIQKAIKEKATRLNLSNLGLTYIPSDIGNLTDLTALDISNNQLMSLPAEIGKLSNLSWLNLKGNKLINLPAEIGQLTSLSWLNLHGNQLVDLPWQIGRLNNLSWLNLKGNNLISVPAEIGQTTNLITVNLHGNQLTSLPEAIGGLTSLIALDISNNNLKHLPKEIGKMNRLIRLDVSYNRLTILPDETIQLTSLNWLNLRGNQLTSLPPSIEQLINLDTLNLSHNQLKSLPAKIGQLTQLNILELDGNPSLSLAPEIRGKGCIEILNFYRQKDEQETDRLYEAKLLIIGEGGAGKTTLARKIQSSSYQLEDEKSTQGIDVIQWQFPLDNGKKFRVNIWDFGGQEIYHTTHQFFLTKRSLYTLVVDTRKEDTDFYYWLNVVELLSDNSPLLIVKNEKQERQREINERQLERDFTNLKKTLATNLLTQRGLEEILKQIKHYISNLTHVGIELPKNWVKVRQALEQESRNYISLDEYLDICQNNGFTRREDKLQLSGYLHDLGVCLHFQEDDLLIKTVILKPTWGTDAVYKVLDNPLVINNQGRFTRDDLKTIWQEDKYVTMQPELLRLMMNFKLCYEIPNSPKTYIATQLLTPNQPDYIWDKSDNLLLRYEYEFMPKGILTRFIVEMHAWIEKQSCVWKSGVVLSKDGTKAEVIELYRYHKGEIRIRISGKRRRDLLTTIRHEFDKIHDSYNSSEDRVNKVQRLKSNTLVPCNCSICKPIQTPHFYKLETLHNFQNQDLAAIQCQISGEMVNVSSLIDDIDSKPHKSIDSQQGRLEEEETLELEYSIRYDKLKRLRAAYAIETDVTIKFKLEKQIKSEEIELSKLTIRSN